MNQEKMGKLIAKLRKEKKLTQEQLGSKLGVNSKAVSKWECGLTTPDISILNELADILGITTTELLDGKQNLDITKTNKIQDKFKIFFANYAIFIILILILIMISTMLSFFFFNTYKKYQLISFKTDNDNIYVEGYIAIYPNRELIILKDVIYHSSEKGTNKEIKIEQLKINIINDREVIFEHIFEKEYTDNGEEKSYYISEVLEGFSDVIIENKNNSYLNNNKLRFVIEYETNDELRNEEYSLSVSTSEISSKFIS